MISIRALRVTALVSALALGALAVPSTLQAQSAQYASLGDALYGFGYHRTVWVSYHNVQIRLNGTFNPEAPWLGDPVSYEARYGAGSWIKKGNVVGERYSSEILLFVIQHPSNPLGIANAGSYVLDSQDREDAVMVSPGGPVSVWDQLIIPLYDSLAPDEPVCAPFSPAFCE